MADDLAARGVAFLGDPGAKQIGFVKERHGITRQVDGIPVGDVHRGEQLEARPQVGVAPLADAHGAHAATLEPVADAAHADRTDRGDRGDRTDGAADAPRQPLVDEAEIRVDPLAASDEATFIAAVRASRDFHHPWIDLADTPARFASMLLRFQPDDHQAYLVRHLSCGALVGYVSVSNIVRGAFQSAYLGYGAFAGHEGRGLMTAGLRAVVRLAFSELGLHRVEANIQPGNQRSLALARRVGFHKEGYSPRYLIVDGDWRDHERWAMRAEEFPP
jgi:[ribosomal protein S5]-alanine N-acetyltransferase